MENIIYKNMSTRLLNYYYYYYCLNVHISLLQQVELILILYILLDIFINNSDHIL